MKYSMQSAKIEFDKIQDECGIYGVYSNRLSDEIKYDVYYGLYALQHRGQESAGIAIVFSDEIHCYKNEGLVSNVLNEKILNKMVQTDLALGHVRYGTEEYSNIENAQPMRFKGKAGAFAIAMNGKITNARILRAKERAEGALFHTNSDVEVIAHLINKFVVDGDIVKGIEKAVEYLEGSFSIGIMTTNSIIAIRDRFGLRPLVIGNKFDDYYIASESCAFDATEVDLIRDVEPGEIIVIDHSGLRSIKMKNIERRPCIFEYIYTARADSIIDGKSVYKARYECGLRLAKRLNIEADLVAGVPDSAVVAARGYAAGANLPYIDVLEKNRYIGRTFIQPTQLMRENSVKIKLNVHRANIEGKRVILVDDSIVRGTTSKKIIELIKHFGAKEVHLVIASPILKHPCYTGIDIESREQLIGAKMSLKEVCDSIGADSLHYMSIKDLVDCCKGPNGSTFCTACFDGDYPDNIEQKILQQRED